MKDNLKVLLENNYHEKEMSKTMDIKFDDGEIKQAFKKYQSGNWEEAINICHKIIKKQPNNFLALKILGVCAYKNNEIEQAIAYYQKSLRINPNDAETHNNLAVALQDNQQIDAALSHCQTAIKFRPNYPEAWNNLGRILQDKGQFEAALEHYQKSLELKPNYASPHLNLSLILLQKGNFIPGFSEYEWRWRTKDVIGRNLSQPVWDGSKFPGKTLLVYTEQGLGDSIQFIRYIPLVKKLGDRVIVECNQPGLKLLLTTVSEIDELLVKGETLPDFDLQIPLMSLPRIFQTTPETIPTEIPYLSVPKSIEFPIPLPPEKNLKVGICWQTSSTNKTSKRRSYSVEYLEKIINIDIDTVNFYILQKEVSVVDNEWLKSQTQIHNLSSSFNNLADTAAAIKKLDLVITIDTVIAHLAGTLGKPVWILLPFVPDWRWMLDRNDSPWYPTARLFRQPKIGDWNSVLIEVKEALMEFIESQNNLPYLPANFEKAYQYYQQNNLVEAERICRLILAEKPQDFQALHLLAVLENLAGRNNIAIQLLNQVINLHPGFSEAYSNLAKLMKKEGRLEEAIAHYQKAISLEPNNSSNYSKLGRIFLDKGQIDAAIMNYEKSREINPDSSWININLGFAWEEKGDLSKARTYYQQAIEINPNYAEAWCKLGNILRKQGQVELAVEYFQKSLELNPDYIEAYNCLGYIFFKLEKFAESQKYYEQVIELNPNCSESYHCLGRLFLRLGKLAESQKYYEQAIRLNTNHVNAHFGLANALLKQGNFIPGFSKYEWRCKTQGFIGRNLSQPVWDGSNFLGKTLFIYTEQGLGDSIQFIRYIPLVKKLGGRVIVECNKPGLKLLFTTVSEIDELFVKGEKLPDFDLQIPLMSLPLIFQTTLETIPTEIPYLSVPKSIDFPIPLAPENNLKVGIFWETKSTSANSQIRSCPVTYLQSLPSPPSQAPPLILFICSFITFLYSFCAYG